jgi:replication-associated recombination protein RarA
MSIAQTHHGYTLDVVRSALQKAIRRGQEDEAAWWAFQLLKYGWFKYLWRTFRGIAAEDIGMGDPDIATKIDAMANNAMESTDGGKKGAFVGLWEMTAVITLCRAPKSWEQTHLLLKQQKLWQDIEHGRTEPPPPKEEALDAHTDAGRRNGVKKSQWWNEGDALEPKAPGHYHHGTDPHASIHGDPEIA